MLSFVLSLLIEVGFTFSDIKDMKQKRMIFS